jgi:hypothetical protein
VEIPRIKQQLTPPIIIFVPKAEIKEKGSEKEYVKTDTHTISYFDF